MKNFLMIISVYLLITPLYTKSQPVTFEKKYDFGYSEGAGDIVQTSDGGYLLVGGQSITFNYVNLLTMKTDSLGDMEWHKITGSGGEWSQHRMVQINDSVYYTAGHSNVYTGNPAARDFLLVKMNGNGDTLWTRTYGGPQGEICNDFKSTSDGGFILAGYTASFGTNVPAYFVKTDLNGDTLWTKFWSGPYGGANAFAIIETFEGGFAITGVTLDSIGYASMFLLKMNSSGQIQWYKLFENSMPAGYFGYDLIQMPDSGFIIGGYRGKYHPSTQLYMFDANLMRVSSSGDSLWSYSYGGLMEEGINKIIKKDNNIYTVGPTYSFGNGHYDILMMSVSEGGNHNWHRYIGGNDWDEGWNIKNTNDGGFSIVGRTDSDCFGCVYFIKTDSLGCVIPDCHLVGVEETDFVHDIFAVYPNPASDYFIIQINKEISGDFKIDMYDVTGRKIALPADEIPPGNYAMYVPADFFSPGIYFITITDKESQKVYSKKIVIQ
ncbi:MAG: T9SS type A sorting domain-containing protein [Bacteroidia bacterium]